MSADGLLRRVLRDERPRLALGGSALLLSAFSNAYAPRAMGKLIDALGARDCSSHSLVKKELLATVLVFGVGAVASGVRVYMFASALEHATAKLREAMFKAALVRSDAASRDTADAAMRPQSALTACDDDADGKDAKDEAPSRAMVLADSLDVDARLACEAATETLQDAARYVSSAVNGFTSLARINGRLAIELACLVPILGVALRRLGKDVRKRTEAWERCERASAQRVRERLGNRVVRVCGGERFEYEEYSRLCEATAAAGTHRGLARGVYHGALDAASKAAVVSVVARGGALVRSGAITPGQLLSFALYAGYASLGLAGLAKWATARSASKRAVQRCLDVVKDAELDFDAAAKFLVDDVVVGEQALVFRGNGPDKQDHFALENVHFRYGGDGAPVLRGCTLRVAAGETHALVGASGAGKSTIVSLLLGIVHPQLGRVVVRGVALAAMAPADLAAHRVDDCAVFDQQASLFDGSVADNILYPRTAANDDRLAILTSAARAADAAEFIEAMPLRFEAPVGALGAALSGGQRARVALARALRKTGARALILDEPTSSLDAASERNALLGALAQAKATKKTVVVVAHSKATIARCDVVSVLKDGAIVETGKYAALVGDANSELNKLLASQPEA